MSGAGATASDVADPAPVPTRQVPRLVRLVAADRCHVAVASQPAARYASRHVRTTDR